MGLGASTVEGLTRHPRLASPRVTLGTRLECIDTGEYAGTITSILPEGAGTAPGAQGLAFIRRAAGGADLRVRVRANDEDGKAWTLCTAPNGTTRANAQGTLPRNPLKSHLSCTCIAVSELTSSQLLHILHKN